MPQIDRPDGARIHYETFGEGYPLLLLAPGGVSSQVEFWERGPINPIREFAGEFQVIGMDQRHAGRSPAPAAEFSYDQMAGDQLAVLDALGLERAHVMGGCIGCAYAWKLIHDAPERISAAVCQDPVGLDQTNSLGTFFQMFDETMRVARAEGMEGVVRAAERDGVFATNHAAGPFAQRLHDDPEFRDELRRMPQPVYLNLMVRFRAGIWPDRPPYFSVCDDWMRTCPAPQLVLPGSDPFHPTGVARRICRTAPRARCLDVEARSEAKLPATLDTLRAFLREHAG